MQSMRAEFESLSTSTAQMPVHTYTLLAKGEGRRVFAHLPTAFNNILPRGNMVRSQFHHSEFRADSIGVGGSGSFSAGLTAEPPPTRDSKTPVNMIVYSLRLVHRIFRNTSRLYNTPLRRVMWGC